VRFHVDSSAAEAHALGFQAEALLDGGVAGEFDLAAGSKDALPGQSITAAQNGGDLARGSGESGCAGYAAVGGNFAARNCAD
jgi:hypothetical protein